MSAIRHARCIAASAVAKASGADSIFGAASQLALGGESATLGVNFANATLPSQRGHGYALPLTEYVF